VAAAKIIDYRELIERSTRDFVGRQWVRDAVDGFLGDAGGLRYFLLLGEPGCGKTTFMADLVRTRGYAHHFIGKGSQRGISSSAAWHDPVRFAESIGYQLLRDYGAWIMDWEAWGIHVSQQVRELDGLLVGADLTDFAALPRPADEPAVSVSQEVERFGPAAQAIGVYVEKFVMDVEQIVHQLLTTPLRKIGERWPEHQLVIVLDGLDEAEGHSNPQRSILAMLPGADLPDNVRFILSSRPGDHLTQDFLGQVRPFWLSEDTTGRQDDRAFGDARDYVRRLAAEPQVHALLTQRGLTPEALAGRVAAASRGNFLYLHHYGQGLRDGYDNLLDLDALPAGLNGIYHDFLGAIKLRREDVSWDDAYKPVLGILAAAREPLTRALISEFASVRQGTAGTILTRIKQFLDATKTDDRWRYAIYHSSFGEYLLSEENEDYIDGHEAHGQVVDYYRRRCQGDWPDVAGEGYPRRHLATHLAGAGLDEELLALITREWWLARARGDGYIQDGFLADVETAWRSALRQDPPPPSVLARLNTARRVVGHQVGGYDDTALRALAWLRREPEAVAHARLRSWPFGQANGLLAVFEVLREREEPDAAVLTEAADAANGIEDRWTRYDVLTRIVVALAHEGRCAAAGAVAERIDVPGHQVTALLKAAAERGQAADGDGVRSLLALAWEAAHDAPSSEPVSVQTLANVVNAALDLGVAVPDGADDELADGIGGLYGNSRWNAEKVAAVTLTRLGAHDLATRLLGGITERWSRAHRKIEIALARASAGAPGADALFDAALDDARHLDSESSRVGTTKDIAIAMIGAGLLDEAATVISEIEGTQEGNWATAALAEALVAAGRLDDARGLAQALSALVAAGRFDQAPGMVQAPGVLADALISERRFGEAAEVVRLIIYPPSRAEAFLRLAQALNGDTAPGVEDPFGLAIEAARVVDDPRNIHSLSMRARTQAKIALVLTETGDPRAADVFHEAAQSAIANLDAEFQAGAIEGVGVALCQTGQYAAAVDLAAVVEYPELRAGVLNALSDAIGEEGDYERAAEVARSVPEGKYRAKVLGRVALTAARGGHDGAAALLDEAVGIATSTSDPAAWVNTLVDVAQAAGRAPGGMARKVLDAALLACDRIDEGEDREHAKHRLALAFAELGEHERALQVARAFSSYRYAVPGAVRDVAVALIEAGQAEPAMELTRSDRDDRDEFAWGNVLPDMAAALTKRGDFGRAEEVVARIGSDFERQRSLEELARALIKAGELAEAKRVAEALDRDLGRGWTLGELAGAYVAAGEEALATSVLDRLGQGKKRDTATGWAVRSLIDAGAFDAAERFARTIHDRQELQWVLKDLAVGMAEAGLIEDAAAVARSIPEGQHGSSYRGSAWQGIAVALAGAGDPRVGVYFDEALRELRTHNPPGDWDLENLGLALARAGSADKAADIIAALQEDKYRAEAWLKLAVILARDGGGDGEQAKDLLARARQLARGIAHYDLPSQDFRELAWALAEQGQFDDALMVARADERGGGSYTLNPIAAAIARSGQRTAVRRIIADHSRAADERASISDRVSEESFDHTVLSSLAIALAGEGECDLALAAVRAMRRADERARTLRTTVATMARSGHFDRALAAADATGLDDYLQTLCAWSPGLAGGEPDGAVAVLREACAVLAWVRPDFRELADLLR
jgi:tetratricopeptide (TPR) repeat protein